TCFFSYPPPPSQIYILSLHDALPISLPGSYRAPPTYTALMDLLVISKRVPSKEAPPKGVSRPDSRSRFSIKTPPRTTSSATVNRSEEHTSELQSRFDLVCRLLLEKKK